MNVDAVLDRVRGVARSWSSWWPVPGPYTSVVVSDADAGMWAWPVSQRCALAVGAVYSALGIYADNIGTLPVQVMRGYEHLPEPSFVARPAGDTVGWSVEVGQILWSLLLRGNAYLLPTSHDYRGFPATFVVLNPDAVKVERMDNGRPRYSWRAPDNTDVSLNDPRTDQLLHVKWQVPPGSFLGVGILDVNAGPGSTLAGVVATEKYSADLMSNPVPPAVLTHPLRLNKTQAEDLQTQWQSSVGRARAVPAVLSGGITYTPLNVTPRDVELIESRRWNATAIATLFRVPPYMLGGSTGDSMTYSTVEGEMSRLWAMTLQPMAMRLARYLEAWVPAGQRLRFNPDALLRSQTLDRFNAHEIALRAGFATVDEVRALENRAPLGAPPEETTPAVNAAQPVADAPPILEVVPVTTETVDVLTRTYTVELAAEGDGRTISGRCVPYDTPANVRDGDGPVYREVWRPGAFRKVCKAPNRTMLNYEHREGLTDQIGFAVALEDCDDGLHATFRAMPGTPGDQGLELIRAGVATGLSIHAWVTPRGSRTASDGTVERVMAERLPHVALCRTPAYAGAAVTAVRHGDGGTPRVEIPKTVSEVLAYTATARARYGAN